MATASLVWILLYEMGTSSLTKEQHPRADPDTAAFGLQAGAA
jgi:hypothetical protein